MSALELTPVHGAEVAKAIREIADPRILVLDGAMGSMIYAHKPTEADYRGTRFADHPSDLRNCTEILVFSQPKMIEDIHRAYLDAGADIIETDSFNSNALSMAEFGLEEHVAELNRAAAEIARRAADDYTRRDPARTTKRLVAQLERLGYAVTLQEGAAG